MPTLLNPIIIRKQLEVHGFEFRPHYDAVTIFKDGVQIEVIHRDSLDKWCEEAIVDYIILDAICDDEES